MLHHPVALFGEAERGDFKTAHICRTLEELVDHCGEPPRESKGLYCAVQVLLYQHDLIFFRVKEEGFSLADYFFGLKLLAERDFQETLTAICIPGVGDQEVILAAKKVCSLHHSLIITSEKDFYDLMTDQKI